MMAWDVDDWRLAISYNDLKRAKDEIERLREALQKILEIEPGWAAGEYLVEAKKIAKEALGD